MSVSFTMEQTLVPWLSQVLDTYGYQAEGNAQIYWLQKICRRLFITLSLIALATCAMLYKDINAVNNQLLLEIRKQNSDIRRSLTDQLHGNLPAQPSHTTTMHSDSDYTSGESDVEDDADSDKTYILPENVQESDLESFMTMPDVDGDSTADQMSMLCELYDLRKEAPEQEEVTSKVDSWLRQSSLGNGNAFGTPVSAINIQGSPYNLRPRNLRGSPDVSPASRVESAKSFSKTVRQMQEISEKNSRLIRAYQQMGVEAQSPGSRGGTLALPLSPLLRENSNASQGLVSPRSGHIKDLERSSIITRSSRGSKNS
ncbi:hypothetical protein EGW08_021184 [Elysia chlorotica]|uniref:Uncharacterized protein n=1 Tax=Elysia chlorotica TaxID=188477 RepID=A0A433SP78_ELYCH|nr:hypothetical protein EGW08_021184 [Elysia chlorotica]